MLDWQQGRGPNIGRRQSEDYKILDHKVVDVETAASYVTLAAHLACPVDRDLVRIQPGVVGSDRRNWSQIPLANCNVAPRMTSINLNVYLASKKHANNGRILPSPRPLVEFIDKRFSRDGAVELSKRV